MCSAHIDASRPPAWVRGSSSVVICGHSRSVELRDIFLANYVEFTRDRPGQTAYEIFSMKRRFQWSNSTPWFEVAVHEGVK